MYQVFQPAVMNWVPLVKCFTLPFCIKKEHPLVFHPYCPVSFLCFQSWHDERIYWKNIQILVICMNHQNLAVSLTPANVLNNYTSQEWKIIFLKFSFWTESNMQRCWITHRIDNEFLYLFSIAKFKAIVRFKMEVTISRWVHFIT